jgi:KipI family sensor histidine kinase inhibitor
MKPRGVREIYPGYSSVYVEWNDEVLSRSAATAWIDRAIAAPPPDARPRDITVGVSYGGCDTEGVAAATGLDRAVIAALHGATTYRVYAMGATPGQPLLGQTDPRLAVPRHAIPRLAVLPLSVAIANRQSTIYPVRMPGGWNVIGTALENVYDPNRDDPFLLRHGDRLHFQPMNGDPPAEPPRLELLPPEAQHPALVVEEPGALDLLVDGGRIGHSHVGMAESGPLDANAARLANALCDNPPGTTVLESTLTGPLFVALRSLTVGAAGAGNRLEIDGRPVGMATTNVGPGQRLRMRPTGQGVRGYLAVSGGFDVRSFLGSTSVDLRGLVGEPLAAGDVLGLACEKSPSRRLHARPTPHRPETVMRLLRGPQWSHEAGRALTAGPFVVETGDRMGIRLNGRAVPGGEILSESPPPGSVQVPSSGQPILLLADRSRSAGYAKPAVIHPADLPLAAQLRAGQAVRFIVTDASPAWYRDIA